MALFYVTVFFMASLFLLAADKFEFAEVNVLKTHFFKIHIYA